MNYPKLVFQKMPSHSLNPTDAKPVPNLRLIDFTLQNTEINPQTLQLENEKNLTQKKTKLETKYLDFEYSVVQIEDQNHQIGTKSENPKPSENLIISKKEITDNHLPVAPSKVISFINLIPETVAQIRKIDDSFSQEGEDEKQLIYLKNLETTLFKIFKGDELALSDFELSIHELHILIEILARKYKGSSNYR